MSQDPNPQFKNRPDKPHGRKRKQAGRATIAKERSSSENTSAPAASSVVPNTSTDMDGASLFGPSNGNIGISGGELNATGRDRINITNIIDGGSGYWKRQNLNKQGSRRPRKMNKPWTPGHDENVHAMENRTKEELTVNTNEIATEAPRILERKSCDIYYQHLAPKGRGSPLYIPGPNQNLPVEYQRTGTRIGDVGIITDHGFFDFLFNICHPADHSINYDGVPDNFQQVLIKPTDIQKHLVFDEESYIASASIKKTYPEGDSSGLKFKSSACEGAILTMPMGSNSEDVGSQEIFRKYMETHIADWYRYVKIVRGRPAKNGDVRLVTGHDKASLWGMAIFTDSTAEDSLLEFQPVAETDIGKVYKWKHSGSAEVRSGPGTREVENLRKEDPDTERRTYQNQCLFVRTLSGTLQENVWKKLAAEFGEVEADEGEPSDDSSSRSPSQRTIRPSCTTTQSASGSSANAPGVHTTLATTNNIPVNGAMRLTSVSPREMTLAYHPSDAINKMLLKLNPGAQIAITHDDDWISVIHKDDFVLPLVEQLYARIQESLVVRQDNDIVFLEKPEYQTYGPHTDNDIEEGLSVSSTALKFEQVSGVYESDDPVDVTPTERDGINLISPSASFGPRTSILSQNPLHLPFPRESPSSGLQFELSHLSNDSTTITLQPTQPYVSRASSAPVLLSNGKPLKSSLKSSSSAPHIRSQSLAPSIMVPSPGRLRPHSDPSTPSLQKNVHFPSQEEGGLATVRLFNRSTKPASLSRVGEDDESETEGEAYPLIQFWRGKNKEEGSKEGGENEVGLFEVDQANSSPVPQRGGEYPVDNVYLETLGFDSTTRTRLTLSGSLLVRNITFHKFVAVRFTLDEWHTIHEVQARYIKSFPDLPERFRHLSQGDPAADKEKQVPTVCPPLFWCPGPESESTVSDPSEPTWDRFVFSINVEEYKSTLHKRAMWLVGRYAESDGLGRQAREWWDNNRGGNYRVQFRRVVQAKESEVEVEREKEKSRGFRRNVVVVAPPSFTPRKTMLSPPQSSSSISSAGSSPHSSSYHAQSQSQSLDQQLTQDQRQCQEGLMQSTLARLEKLSLRKYAPPAPVPVSSSRLRHSSPPNSSPLCESPPSPSASIEDGRRERSLSTSSSDTTFTSTSVSTSAYSTALHTPTQDEDEGPVCFWHGHWDKYGAGTGHDVDVDVLNYTDEEENVGSTAGIDIEGLWSRRWRMQVGEGDVAAFEAKSEPEPEPDRTVGALEGLESTPTRSGVGVPIPVV